VRTLSSVSLAGLEPIGLSELEAVAALLARQDRKYIVPPAALDELVAGLARHARALEIDGSRTFRYESVYFDTPSLDAYRAAAHGRPRRFKVRTRSYLDSDVCLLEVKTRARNGMTLKHRHPYSMEDRDRLTGQGLVFLSRFHGVADVTAELRPVLTTAYRRTTLFDSASDSRITIDTDLVCSTPEGSTVGLSDVALVETKSAHGPTAVDRRLWASRIRPVRVSKYATGLAAIRDDLPSNRWRPVLQRHFPSPLSDVGG
jgi:hypothetical protein